MNDMETDYNGKLLHLKEINNKFYVQIQKFTILNKGSSISMSEMNPYDMVNKLLVVSSNPFEIYDAFNQIHPGFFS
jgi:hypothetical protein